MFTLDSDQDLWQNMSLNVYYCVAPQLKQLKLWESTSPTGWSITECGLHTRNCNGRTYCLFPVFFLQRYSTKDNIICMSRWSFQYVFSRFQYKCISGRSQPLSFHFSLLVQAVFVWGNNALPDTRLQLHDWSKQIWSKRKWNTLLNQIGPLLSDFLNPDY